MLGRQRGRNSQIGACPSFADYERVWPKPIGHRSTHEPSHQLAGPRRRAWSATVLIATTSSFSSIPHEESVGSRLVEDAAVDALETGPIVADALKQTHPTPRTRARHRPTCPRISSPLGTPPPQSSPSPPHALTPSSRPPH